MQGKPHRSNPSSRPVQRRAVRASEDFQLVSPFPAHSSRFFSQQLVVREFPTDVGRFFRPLSTVQRQAEEYFTIDIGSRNAEPPEPYRMRLIWTIT